MKQSFLTILNLVCLAMTTAYSQNNCLHLNGSGDHVNLGQYVANDVRTIELWFNPETMLDANMTDPSSLAIRNTGLGENGEFGLFIGPSTWLGEEGRAVLYHNVNGVRRSVVSNSNSWAPDHWYHVAGVIDPITGMKLYINGVLQSDSDSFTGSSETRTETFAVGKWGDSDSRYFHGKIDELRIWGRALAQNEILADSCNMEAIVNSTGLQARYTMNAQNLSTLIDEQNTFNGLINGCNYLVNNPCSTNEIEQQIQNQLVIYPNPTTSEFRISADLTLSENTLVSIYGINGQLFVQQQITNDQPISIDHLSSGTYIVRIQDQEILLAELRLVKR